MPNRDRPFLQITADCCVVLVDSFKKAFARFADIRFPAIRSQTGRFVDDTSLPFVMKSRFGTRQKIPEVEVPATISSNNSELLCYSRVFLREAGKEGNGKEDWAICRRVFI